jgi:nitroreductase
VNMANHIGRTAETTTSLHPVLAGRWSPRGFDRSHRLSDVQLAAVLEAARWAPSASNSQPWRFLVTRRGDADFDRLAARLAAGNRSWARHASALILVATETVDETGRRRPWAWYDAGQAVAGLTVQAQVEGLAVHQMGGFDADAAARTFRLEETTAPVVVLALGRHDPLAELPEPLASRERAPRTRLPLESLVLATTSRDRRVA